ncbi:MAG: metallophosphoesterase [Microscillaceae bacterium]|nr:metallophosphoesterase [Microscillaceae bacterium]
MTLFDKIPKPNQGTRWVIPDIHGCVQTFKALVREKIQLQKTDHLYLLGDYVDRGPDSGGVIDFILDLQDEGFLVFPLRGNHDHDILDHWNYFWYTKTLKNLELFHEILKQNNSLNLLDENGKLRTRYEYFLKGLPYYFELPDFYLVHAGFNFNIEKPFEDYESMLWDRNLVRKKRKIQSLQGRKIIVGHTVESLPHILQRIQEQNQIITLDNGCFYAYQNRDQPEVYEGISVGNLCALNLDTLELITQINIDD